MSSELSSGPSGEESMTAALSRFETEVPFPVTLDLPGPTARWKALLGRTQGEG
ncbi:hypothetical protein EDD30_5445 [Couchioplanes caeruleus]|uniref:Uncharacterized protein n=1 Tax=Couchioplanes caeruleus TaxID=56438 RepID=A0A3N1GQK8_9ACTN|nr:hypothetical protein EDD30_5445 [Couchioplanes caeruleus]